jgi:uncharacterized protein (DUF697 family)
MSEPLAIEALVRRWPWLAKRWPGGIAPAPTMAEIEALAKAHPPPALWLFGKTQSGKSSIVRHLTGATAEIIGRGFRPLSATTLRYAVPDDAAPVMIFLDTRGLDDANYDPAMDIATCTGEAQAMIVTAKIGDFAQANLINALSQVRAANRARPVLLVLTCVHEVQVGVPHGDERATPILEKLIARHGEAFGTLIDDVVCIDFTRPEEGFADFEWNAAAFRAKLHDLLPAAYGQRFERGTEAMQRLKDLREHEAAPVIASHAAMAAAAGAVPVPFVDLALLPPIQARMLSQLAAIYHQEMNTARYLELAGSLGLGLVTQQAMRSLAKLVPGVGSAIAAATAFAATYALGKAFALYFERVQGGDAPSTALLKQLYKEQFDLARKLWSPAA